ncbi:MAG: heat-inducible transcriptional repressor HrcA [Halanaerobiales bacterium]
MMVSNLDDRKKEILKAIIQEHIITAEPVGSRTLSKNYDFGVSSATIRNEMADLEDMGYLEQPHTSAGRIPSDKGYRYYVDVLMDQQKVISTNLQRSIKQLYKEEKDIKDIISETVKMLSNLIHYTALISEPQLKESRIRKVQVIEVARKSLMIILITDTGMVNNKLIHLEKELNNRQVRYINRYLSDRLENKKLSTLDQEFMKKLEGEIKKRLSISKKLLDLINKELEVLVDPADLQIYLGGTSYILEQPEFNDLDALKQVMRILDQEDVLRKLIGNVSEEGIEVKIGRENNLEEIQNCSLVVATYSLEDKAIGKIGVIGPTRMEYPRVISTVDFVADVLGEIISKASR